MSEPAKRKEESKIVEIDGRKFKIIRFDAMTGSYVAFKIATKALPMGLSVLMKDELGGIDASKIEMSRNEFKELQIDCLNICSEVVEGSTIPLLNDNNSFRAIGLENDTKTVVALTVHALVFNLKDFFGESVFKQVLGSMKL